MIMSLHFISGVMLGFEMVLKRDVGEDEDGHIYIVDLLIVRLIIG